MKTTLLAAAGYLLLCAGCSDAPTPPRVTEVSDGRVPTTCRKFQFQGHDYLLFHYSGAHDSPIVHDPDCRKCCKPGKKKATAVKAEKEQP